MKDILVSAAAGAVTALIVTLVTQYLIYVREFKTKRASEKDALLREYLNPLRLSLVEVFFRLGEIESRVRSGDEDAKAVLSKVPPAEISSKTADWFNGEGCYLISSCYLTAVLFFRMNKLREDWPFIRLEREEDTELGSLIVRVSRGFAKSLGVFYATQPSIGVDLYLQQEKRLMTYREFCEMLRDPARRTWCDRLLSFFKEIGEGKENRLQQIRETLAAVENLSGFLDKVVGGGKSIKARLEQEVEASL
jgi:hypothetical protein